MCLKHGFCTSDGHISIGSPEGLGVIAPDYIVIFVWNYADDIMRKLDKLRSRDVKFIIPMPKMRIIEAM